MTIRTRLSICRRKQVFASEEQARASAARFDPALLPYRCDRCRRFHLTSRRKGKRVEKGVKVPVKPTLDLAVPRA